MSDNFRDHADYFARRAADELRLAEAAIHPSVKARHSEFAAEYLTLARSPPVVAAPPSDAR